MYILKALIRDTLPASKRVGRDETAVDSGGFMIPGKMAAGGTVDALLERSSNQFKEYDDNRAH